MLRWTYGITTIPSRRCNLFLRTLESLRVAGFDRPRLFVDGCDDPKSWAGEFGLEVTARHPAVRTAGNWLLSMAELYFRDPSADRFALFQDDFVCVRNLREYLDRCKYPERGYWNLYTSHPRNEKLRTEHGGTGWLKSDQMGQGALALVFSREAVMTLLSARHPNGQGGLVPYSHLVERAQNPHRGWRAIDGGVVEALGRAAGWSEWVHSPSLVQHTGLRSSMGNDNANFQAESFPGESQDALDFLPL